MRSPSIAFLLISLFFVKFARSQSDELLIQGQTGKLYLSHTVVAKENWFSIGRLYNGVPKDIAAFNNLALTKPLEIGEQLQIPLTAVNFSQTGQKAPNETLVPVYHIIQEKEWMYRISVNHNKVPIPNLEKWNNINKDQVKAGLHLIVGYLKVKTALSALAAGAATPSVANATPGTGNLSKKDTAVIKKTVPAPKEAAKDVVNKDVAKEMPPVKKEVPAVKEIPKDVPVHKETQTAPPVVKTQTPVNNESATSAQGGNAVKPSIHFNGGSFLSDYGDGGKSISGTAGTFKSTSGWQDGKYYALMNNVPVGTIVKVTLASANKSIYAKVLGQLPDMKESTGLAIRISNAAANELGEGEGKFGVEVRY